MSKFYARLGVTTPFDPSHTYTTSWLLPPWLLAFIRSLFSLYAFCTIFTIFGYYDSHGEAIDNRQWFSYFTNLTYVGLAFYFLFSAIHTWSYWRTGKALLQSWPRPLQALHAVFYTTVVTYPFLVTIVYWGVLYKAPWFPVVEDAWSNVRILSGLAFTCCFADITGSQVSKHGINSAWALFEVILTCTSPRPLLHMLFLIILLALYLGLAYLTKATEGFYVYSFLDPSTGVNHVVAYCIGIPVAACVIFGIVEGILWLRNKATKNKAKYTHELSEKPDESVGETYGEVVEMREEMK